MKLPQDPKMQNQKGRAQPLKRPSRAKSLLKKVPSLRSAWVLQEIFKKYER